MARWTHALGGLLLATLPVASGRSDAARTTREQARALEITSPVAPVRERPDAESALLGTVHGGTRLAFGVETPGPGCRGVFVELSSGGFVCSRHTAYSRLEPGGVTMPAMREGALLPHRYVSTQRDETPSYASPEDHFRGVPAATHGRGYAFVSYGRREVSGVRFERLQNGSFILAEHVSVARPSRFEGVEVAPGQPLDHGFVLEDTLATAEPGARTGRAVRRRELVHVAAVEGEHARLVDGTFVPRAHLRLATTTAPPEGVGPDELWIDVHVAEQVLVAYVGARPVYVTLVSSGADRAGRRTPTGTFRIASKYAETTMDDFDNDNPGDDYLVERVPWVQYFDGSIALHAAFWHDDFGRRRSHGCVNLSPKDARRLFGMTAPELAPGFSTRQATATRPGTVVRVRP